MRHVVVTPQSLGDCLRSLLAGSSGRTRKQYLEHGRVRVNDAVVRAANRPLVRGDVVELGTRGYGREEPLKGLRIVHEDDAVIVIDKGPGLLTIATTRERERTAYRQLSSHVKVLDPTAKVFIVHRLDRLASGLLVFAKSIEAQTLLQGQLRARSMERVYRALCVGTPTPSEGLIDAPLFEGKSGVVHRDRKEPPAGRGQRRPRPSPRATGREGDEPGRRSHDARTRYRVLLAGERTSLLEVRLETGRKHQIRVHLASIGHPICGDSRYGSKLDPLNRLALHATTLGFEHPAGGRLRFESPVDWVPKGAGSGA